MNVDTHIDTTKYWPMKRWATRQQLTTIAAGLLASMFVLWRALPTLSSQYLGREVVDSYGTKWYYWFTSDALSNGRSLGNTDLFYFPIGRDIVEHMGANLLDALASVPFTLLFGQVFGFNLFVVTAFILSGYAFYKLATHICTDQIAVAISTVLFTVCPFALFELTNGRPTQAILGLLVLTIYLTLKVTETPGWKSPIYGGIALALVGYQYWFYAIFVGLAIAGLGVVNVISPSKESGGRRQLTLRLLGMGAVSVLLVSPVAIPMILRTAGQGAHVGGLIDASPWTLTSVVPKMATGELVSFMTFQPFAGGAGWFINTEDGEVMWQPLRTSLPWAAFLTVPIGFYWATSRWRKIFLAMAIPVIFLGIGPVLVAGDKFIGNPFYKELLESVSFMRRLRWTGRVMGVISIIQAILVLFAIAGIRKWPKPLSIALIGLIVCLRGGDLRAQQLAPLPSWSPNIPAGYHCLKQLSAGAVIEVPFGVGQEHLLFQTHHQHPIFGGSPDKPDDLLPEKFAEYKNNNSFLTSLSTSRLDSKLNKWSKEDLQKVIDDGYRYVVLQKYTYQLPETANTIIKRTQDTHRRVVDRALRTAFGRPIYSDVSISIFGLTDDGQVCSPKEVTRDLEVRSVQQNELSTSKLSKRTLTPFLDELSS